MTCIHTEIFTELTKSLERNKRSGRSCTQREQKQIRKEN